MGKIRLEEIDIIKGLCMVLVFWNHSILYFPINLRRQYEVCQVMIDVIGSWYMQCFFLVSGFLFAYSKKTYGEVLSDKIKRLIVPYVFVCVVSFLMKLAVPSMVAFKQHGLWDFFQYYLFEGGDRWFIYLLFWMFLLLTPLKKYITSSTFCILLSLLLLYTLVESHVFFKFYPLQRLLAYSRYFICGFLMRKYYNQIKPYFVKYRFVFLGIFLMYNVAFNYKYEGKFWDVILPYTGVFFCFSFSIWLLRFKKGFVSTGVNAIRWIGKYSLQFYVMTGFVLVPVRSLVVTFMGVRHPLLVIPLVFSLQMVVAWLFVKLCERFRVSRFLMGY